MRTFYTILIMTVFLFSACGNTQTSTAAYYSDFDQTITEKYWKLKILYGKEIRMEEHQEREAYFTLKTDDNRLSGFGGCNEMMGSYELDDLQQIRFSKISTTRKACPLIQFDENEYVQMFEDAAQYKIGRDQLTLLNNRNEELAKFEAVYF